jgi:hypothetical protein
MIHYRKNFLSGDSNKNFARASQNNKIDVPPEFRSFASGVGGVTNDIQDINDLNQLMLENGIDLDNFATSENTNTTASKIKELIKRTTSKSRVYRGVALTAGASGLTAGMWYIINKFKRKKTIKDRIVDFFNNLK